MTAIDLNYLQPSVSRDECLAICVNFGLVDMMQHGDREYIRMTQQGVNVLCIMLELMADMSDPDTPSLKAS